MTTEAVKIIVGAEDQTQPLESAEKRQQRLEKTIGDTADTSARTTAAIAIMMQSMGDSAVGQMISDLMLVKASLDSVRAATASNASKFEKFTAKASLYFAAFNVGYKIGDFFSGGAEEAKKLNDEIERGQKLQDKLLAAIERQRSSDQFKIGLIDDPQKQIAELEKLRAVAEKNKAGAESSKRAAKNSFDTYNTWENNWLRINKSIQIAEKERYELAGKRLENYQANLQELNTQIEQIRLAEEARIEKEREAKRQARADNSKAIIEALKKEAETIKLTADELTIYNLKANEASIYQIDLAESLIRKRNAQKAELEQQKEAVALAEKQKEANASYLEGLKQQLIALRDGAKAAEQYRLAQLGITQQTQREAAQYKQQIELIKQRNAAQAEAKRIIEANMTPLQRFKQDIEKLAKLRIGKFLSEDVFNREKERIKKQLLGNTGQNQKFKSDLQTDSSRFLARGRQIEPINQTANNTAKQVELMKKAQVAFDAIIAKLSSVEENTRTEVEAFG